MRKILRYLEDPTLWVLWYIYHYTRSVIFIIMDILPDLYHRSF